MLCATFRIPNTCTIPFTSVDLGLPTFTTVYFFRISKVPFLSYHGCGYCTVKEGTATDYGAAHPDLSQMYMLYTESNHQGRG